MAEFYFFTDIDLLNAQQASEAFGPMAAELNKDRYRVCSLHSAASNPNAYAVCDGSVIVQQNSSDPGLVNLIVKPFQVGDNSIGMVKFFIYKGIRKDSLIDGEFVAHNTNELTISIKKNQDLLNANEDKRLGNPAGTTTTRPSNKSLGYDIVSPDADSIEEIFFREDADIQFPSVKAGWSLGTFRGQGFGFEIILEKVGYDPALQLARIMDHIVQVDTLPPGATQGDTFRHWNKKEEVINYCDAAAFYGSFYTEKLFYMKFGTRHKVKDVEIYNLIVAKFYNKNIIYLDIRNEKNRSLNYNSNYGQMVQVAYSESQSLAQRNYYESGWPILRIVNSSFPAGNNTKKNILKLAFPVGDNTIPKVHLASGFYNSGTPSGKFPKRPGGKSKFTKLTIPESSSFTSEIALAIPNEATTGNTTAVSTLIRLRYVKMFDHAKYPMISASTVVESANLMDNVFLPLDLKIPVKERLEGQQIRSKIYYSETYIDDDRELGFDFIAANAVAIDNNNVIFSIYPTDTGFYYHNVENKLSLVGVNLVGSGNDYLSRLASASASNTILIKSKIETGTEDIPVLEYQNTSDERYKKFRSANLEDLCAITITKQEYQAIVNQAKSLAFGFEQSLPVHMGLRHIETKTDTKNNEYKVYELSLMGYKVQSTSILLDDQLTGTKVYLRTSPPRKRIYASKAASNNINLVANEREVREKGLVLRSWLLKGIVALQEVLEGGEPIRNRTELGQNFVHRGPQIGKLQAALRVLIPHYDPTYFESVKSLKLDSVFGPITSQHVSIYQTLVGLPATGAIGSKTLSRIDKDLFDIHFFNADASQGEVKVLHIKNKSISVGKFTVVSNGHIKGNDFSTNLTGLGITEIKSQSIRTELRQLGILDAENVVVSANLPANASALDLQELLSLVNPTQARQAVFDFLLSRNGANFRRGPGGESAVIRNLRYNTKVRIVSIAAVKLANGALDYSWCYVQIDPELEFVNDKWVPKAGQEDKVFGYIAYNLLWTRSEIPDPGAQLHEIESGESLINLVNTVYDNPTAGPDFRYYINVLLYVNNPEGTVKKTIYSLSKQSGQYTVEQNNVDAAIYLKNNKKTWYSSIKKFIIDVPLDGPLPLIPLLSPLPLPVVPLAQRTWQNLEQSFFGSADPEKQAGWQDIADIEFKSNFTIWLPSKAFADSLKKVIDIGPVSNNLLSTCLDIYNNNLKVFIDKNWPVGTGFTLEWGFGATVPIYIPIAIDKDHTFYLWRESDKEFKLKVRGEVSVAVDTGLGLGAMFGVGSKYKYKYKDNDRRKFALGGALGAQLKAGAKITISQEYTYNITQDYALANMFATTALLLGSDELGAQPVGLTLLNLFKPYNIDPLDYLSEFSISSGLFVDGQAGAFVKLKLAEENAKNFFTSTRGDGDRGGFNKSSGPIIDYILGLFTASINASLTFEAIIGLEVKFPEKELNPANGLLVQKNGEQTKVSIVAEITNLANFSTTIPFIPIPQVNIGATLGIKVNFTYPHNETAFNTQAYTPGAASKYTFQSFSLVYKSGELDIYEGPGTEVEIQITPPSVSNFPTNFTEFVNIISKVLVKKRVGDDKIVGTKYRQLFKQQNDIVDNLKRSYRKNRSGKTNDEIETEIRGGLNIDGYATFKFEAIPSAFVTLLNTIYNDVVINRGKASSEAILYLMEYLILGRPPEIPQNNPGVVNEIIKTFKVFELEIHSEVGAGVAAEVSAGFLEKVRLRGNASFNIIIYHKNLLAIVNDLQSLYQGRKEPFNETSYLDEMKATFLLIQDKLAERYTETN